MTAGRDKRCSRDRCTSFAMGAGLPFERGLSRLVTRTEGSPRFPPSGGSAWFCSHQAAAEVPYRPGDWGDGWIIPGASGTRWFLIHVHFALSIQTRR